MSIGPWREGDTNRLIIKFKPVEVVTTYLSLSEAEQALVDASGADVISLSLDRTTKPYALTKVYQPDITGYKFWFTCKSAFDNTDNVAVVQVSKIVGDDSEDDPVNGLVVITSPIIAAGSYYYDVQMLTPGGDIKTIIPEPGKYKQKLQVVNQVTRAAA